MTARDLLGDEIRQTKGTTPFGYAGRPGAGPAGETCGTCAYAVRGRRFAKCEKYSARWTHGVATDIRLRTAACELWAPAG